MFFFLSSIKTDGQAADQKWTLYQDNPKHNSHNLSKITRTTFVHQLRGLTVILHDETSCNLTDDQSNIVAQDHGHHFGMLTWVEIL